MAESNQPPRVVGRYALHREIASGGMASVHLGRLLGPVGFARTVAIKRLHAQFAKDPEFVAMFMDEARVAARIRHPNVVPTLDVVAEHGELFLVMEYVEGESLSRLVRLLKGRNEPFPVPIAAAIVSGVLQGLHAAHEARGEGGEPLDIVHRDVSPQNVIVGVDGTARVLDFGIAKAAGRLQSTREGQLKGKVSYMPVEQIQGVVTRRTDVYSAAVVLWELLAGQRLFQGADAVEILNAVVAADVPPPSRHRAEVSPALDALVLRALSRDPRARPATARELARALEEAVRAATPVEVAEWLHAVADAELTTRAHLVAEIESESRSDLSAGLAVLAVPTPVVPTDVEAKAPPPAAVVGAPPTALAPTPVRRWAVLAAIVLALGLVAAVVVGALGPKGTAVVGTPSAAPAAPPSAAPSASPAASPTAPNASPSPTPSAPPSAPPSSPAPSTSPSAKPSLPKATAAPKLSDCTPPYWLDKDGKKHFKAHCPLE